MDGVKCVRKKKKREKERGKQKKEKGVCHKKEEDKKGKQGCVKCQKNWDLKIKLIS
jgi:hypothetical protein